VHIRKPEQVRRAFARLDILEGDVIRRLPFGNGVAQVAQHLLAGRPDIDLAGGHVELSRQLANFFLGKPCKVFVAPFDVRLPKKNESDMRTTTVVQPDILVICDSDKIDDRGCRGAPDLAIEVLSPSSVSHDQLRKLNLYESRGVREYWIVHTEGSVMVFHLGESGRYGRPDTYDRTTKIETPLFPGLSIDLSTVFPEKPRVVRQSPRNDATAGER